MEGSEGKVWSIRPEYLIVFDRLWATLYRLFIVFKASGHKNKIKSSLHEIKVTRKKIYRRK